jgi:hypothetical protein
MNQNCDEVKLNINENNNLDLKIHIIEFIIEVKNVKLNSNHTNI